MHAHTHVAYTNTHTYTHRPSDPRKPCKPQEEAVIMLPEELTGCNLKR